MAKSNLISSITSFGIYDKWNEKSKDLPKITKFTTDVPAEIDIEFGFIINIKKGKGKKITFCIYHPNIPDKKGSVMPPFTDDVYIRDNDWSFYLGDTIWAPIENKVGDWRMTIEYDGQLLADKTFNVNLEEDFGEARFWKRAGY
jgi:hypothetical protein